MRNDYFEFLLCGSQHFSFPTRERYIEAKKWVEANGQDEILFRLTFEDAKPKIYIGGSKTLRGH